MYISRRVTLGGYLYSINQSYYVEPYWRSRVILDLGRSPRDYVHYLSEVAFYIPIEDELLSQGISTDQFELERLFYPFLTSEAQRWLSLSDRRRISKGKFKSFPPQEVHYFDRRRIIALKLDHREPWRVEDHFFPFYAMLKEKSRDELENLLWDYEDKLTYREKLRYLLAIFRLNYAGSLEQRDEAFLNTLCQLSKDENYQMGLTAEEVLRNYLCRYVWLYFDSLAIPRRPPYHLTIERSILSEVAEVLSFPLERVYLLSKKELMRLLRERIKSSHPDLGGDKEDFLRIRGIMERFSKMRF